MLEILMAKDLLYAASASMWVLSPDNKVPQVSLLKSFQNRARAVGSLNLHSQHLQRGCWCPNDLTASRPVLYADT